MLNGKQLVTFCLVLKWFRRCLNRLKWSKRFYTILPKYACKKNQIYIFMHVTYQVYIFINIINLSIQIYPYKTKLDLPRVRLNSRLNSCLARLMLFISVPFRPFRPFFSFFDRLNGQPFNFRLPPKQNTLPPFTVYWLFKRPFNPFRRTTAREQGKLS